jgi:hypothetical protein
MVRQNKKRRTTMKRVILLVACSMLLCSAAYARRIAWIPTERPPVSLAEAITLAETQLKKEKVQYFCIGASLAKTFSEGDWQFSFSSREGKRMTVSVGSDKKVWTSEHGFDY